MIDVDPNFSRTDRGQGRSEPVLNRGVERNRNIDIFGLGRRFREQVCARKKTVFLEHAFFVPNANILAQLFKGEAERELAAEGIAIRSNVTKNSEPLMFAQRLADSFELGRAHACFSWSDSICCKISSTREPRAIDSSR